MKDDSIGADKKTFLKAQMPKMETEIGKLKKTIAELLDEDELFVNYSDEIRSEIEKKLAKLRLYPDYDFVRYNNRYNEQLKLKNLNKLHQKQ